MKSKVFENYTFGPKLGQGAFGEVYLIKSNETGERFVLKTMESKNTKLEDRLCTILNHKNIVKCVDSDVFLNKLHLIFEYANGGSLADKFKKVEGFSESETKEIVKDILEALRYCHSLRICHRDIKFDNILIFESPLAGSDSRGTLVKSKPTYKLSDWGLSIEISLDKSYQSSGSPLYMAPELYTDKRERLLCDKTDIWSLGIVAFICLEGARPFKGKTDKELGFSILTTQPVFKHCSEEAREFIMRLLNKDPKKRPSAEEALRDKWLQD
jgi:serine/threonine protein kinase